MTNEKRRKRALAKHLEVEPKTIDIDKYDTFTSTDAPGEYMVLTDSEADEIAKERARETLWAFRAEFLFPDLDSRALEAVKKMQGELCEDAQEIVVKMLGERVDEVLDDALSADGRGHFISGYDGDEHEVTVDNKMFFIYRTN